MNPFSKRPGAVVAISVLAALAATAAVADVARERLVRDARFLCEETFRGSRNTVPRQLLKASRCVAVFPNLQKAALGIGGTHGTGVVSCRGEGGAWSPPSFLVLSRASVGLQIGYRSEGLLMFLRSDAAKRLLFERSFSLGGEVAYAVGTLEGSTGADALEQADVILYGRSRGFFAGASFEGTRLRVGKKAIRKYYGKGLWPEEILLNGMVPELPPQADRFMEILDEADDAR